MASRKQLLDLEELKWRTQPYRRFLNFNEEIYSYKVDNGQAVFYVEVHTKQNDVSEEIIVMVEVSQRAFLGSFSGAAKYFAIDKNDSVRDATPDEIF